MSLHQDFQVRCCGRQRRRSRGETDPLGCPNVPNSSSTLSSMQPALHKSVLIERDAAEFSELMAAVGLGQASSLQTLQHLQVIQEHSPQNTNLGTVNSSEGGRGLTSCD